MIPVAIVFLDLLIKYWAMVKLMPIGTIPVIEGVFHLTYVTNSGAAFGILQNARWVFIALTLLVIGAIIYVIKTKKPASLWTQTALAFLLGGEAGNLIVRVRLGYVIDMFDFRLINFPVFNVADTFVCAGAGILFFTLMFGDKNDKS